MFRIRAWMNPRLFPGVMCWRSMIRNRSLPSFIRLPLRSRVAWMENAMTVYPFDRSTYGRGQRNRATMRNVAFTRWDLGDLLALHEQIGQLVGTDAPGWTPPADLYETPSEFVL